MMYEVCAYYDGDFSNPRFTFGPVSISKANDIVRDRIAARTYSNPGVVSRKTNHDPDNWYRDYFRIDHDNGQVEVIVINAFEA